MKFNIKKEKLLKYIKKITNIIIKNPVFPILENIVIDIDKKRLNIISSNLEIEINIFIKKKNYIFFQPGKTSISGKKILQICRNAPKNTILNFHLINNKINITICNSSFQLITLSQENFPIFQKNSHQIRFVIPQYILKKIILLTQFSIANNDVRNFLNGLLIEKKNNYLYGVATDGYRLAMYKTKTTFDIPSFSIILSKKSISELFHLLKLTEENIIITINKNNIKFKIKNISLTTKLIEGNFPNYNDIILKKSMQYISIPLENLKNSLLRTSILCDINFKGVELIFYKNLLKIKTKNQENEKSEDSFKIQYKNEKIKFSINIFYLLDILNVINSKNIYFMLNIPVSSIQIKSIEQKKIHYVIMPLRL